MASMVAKACGSTSKENGSRTKRKFRGDPPLSDPLKPITGAGFEFSAEKFETHSRHSNMCQVCSDVSNLGLGYSCAVGTSEPNLSRTWEGIDRSADDFRNADWGDIAESELEHLVLTNLDTIFRSAIQKIVARGYNKEVANKAILRSGLWYGRQDTMSNLVENTLEFLRNDQKSASPEERHFQDLPQMEKYILAELVCLLREIRPFFSIGDAMWCLLVCDMDISHACAMDCFETSDPNPPLSDIAAPEMGKVPALNPPQKSFILKGQLAEECQKFSPGNNYHKTGGRSAEKSVSNRRVAKRDYISRQKSMHFEKHHRSFVSRSSSRGRAGRLTSFGGLISDEKLKGVAANSTGVKPVSTESAPPSSSSSSSSSSPDKEAISNPVHVSRNLHASKFSFPHDATMKKLVPRVRELQDQLQEWTRWANRKVMQAARRLSKEKDELKTLRREKEETERLVKEKQLSEENAMKKLSEMEKALLKADKQAKTSSCTVKKLQVENGLLRRGLEGAKLYAVESGANFQQVSAREKKISMEVQEWEKQKIAFQDELVSENLKLKHIQQKLQQARFLLSQVEGKANQEQKNKDEILSQVISMREARHEIDASTRSGEETIRSAAEPSLRKQRADIERLQGEISSLRWKTDSLRRAAAIRRDSENSGGGVRRERECVVCLSEETSVVFLPCAHQVVCGACDEVHEERGMKECPSCRSSIRRRIRVRYGGPS